MKFWAIRQVSTGNYLPEAKGGYTYTMPSPSSPPRLFNNRAAARRALTAWLKGKWVAHNVGDWESPDVEITIKKMEGRDKEDMCVVRLMLVTVRGDD